tara:strand:+ start:13894 stop:14523 length:630 start_codon:yes stop_codon:yes gene_type:complete
MAGLLLRWRVISFDVGIRNLGICILHAFKNSSQLRVQHFELVDILEEGGCKTRNANKVPGATLRQCLMQMLQSRQDIFVPPQEEYDMFDEQVYACTTVPTFVAVEMQTKQKFATMAATIYDWFEFKHGLEVEYVHGSRKLTVYGKGGSGAHATNKQQGIWGCEQFCKEHTELNQPFLEWFGTLKKKDDVADSVLQAVWLHSKKMNTQPK